MTLSSRTPEPVTVTRTPGNALPFWPTTVPSIVPTVWAVAVAAADNDKSMAAMARRPPRRVGRVGVFMRSVLPFGVHS